MAHFAKLDENNFVIEVNVVDNFNLDPDDEENSGIAFLTNWSGGYSNWKQTSYNRKFRKNYAAVGGKYDAVNDIFIAPQPYPSWSLDDNFDWQPPISRPDGAGWYWDETNNSWITE